jgi:lipoprotein LprA
MKLQIRAGIAALSVVVTAALVLTGCSSSTKNPTPNVDAAKIVKQAADAMRKVTGMHLTVAVQGNVPNLDLTKLEGDVSNTPQTHATGTVTLTIGSKNVDAKFVYVDGTLYADVAEAGEYTDYGDGMAIYDVSTLLDPDKGLARLLSDLEDPKAAATEQVNGIQTTKITGMSSSNDIARLSGNRVAPEKETTVPTTVWIASDGSYHLVKLEIVPVQDATVTLTMSEWGKQFTVTKPE